MIYRIKLKLNSAVFCFTKNPRGRLADFRYAHPDITAIKLNSGLASTEVKTENSNVVIFVKIIKENLTKCFALHLTKF